MWITRRPAASSRAAAATTSITMKGGTSLRAEGAAAVRSASSLRARRRMTAPLPPHLPRLVPPSFARLMLSRRRRLLTVPRTASAVAWRDGIEQELIQMTPRSFSAWPRLSRPRVAALARVAIGDRARRCASRRSGACPGEGRRRVAADHPRRRDRAAAARLFAADPARRRPRPAQHPRRHHQRPQLQRLRDRRQAHLRQCRAR